VLADPTTAVGFVPVEKVRVVVVTEDVIGDVVDDFAGEDAEEQAITLNDKAVIKVKPILINMVFLILILMFCSFL
jgi:hypothetical protein